MYKKYKVVIFGMNGIVRDGLTTNRIDEATSAAKRELYTNPKSTGTARGTLVFNVYDQKIVGIFGNFPVELRPKEREESEAKDFFSKSNCDRCGKPIAGTRMMSMFNKECLCESCIEVEKARPDYAAARKADQEHIASGELNFPGIGHGTAVKATEVSDGTIAKTHCDWVVEQAKELKALLAYDSDRMIVLNKTRALSAIDTAMSSLSELKAYIENVEG